MIEEQLVVADLRFDEQNAALTQGDIDFQAGVGPASVNATMTGFATRAIWFSSDKISYWLMAKPLP